MTTGPRDERPFSDEDYARYSDLILARTGLSFSLRRKQALGRALVDATRSADCADLGQYFARLATAPTDGALWDDLIKALTVCETYFFRDPEHIEALQQRILPDLIERHRADRCLRIWSAGCATGEEPYTVAILLSQLLPDIEHWKILILATDINRQALRQAAAGHYRQWSFRQTSIAMRNAFFIPRNDLYELAPRVRQQVTFAYLNLAEANYPSPTNYTSGLDLILCRNVTIYLPENVIRDIAQRFWHCLTPDGWLVVGPSETHIDIYSQFQMVKLNKMLAYRRCGSPIVRTAGVEPLPPFCQEERITHWEPGSLAPLQPMAPCPVAPVRETTSRQTSDEAIRLDQTARKLLKQGRAGDAKTLFLDCLALDPERVSALCSLARIEADAGHLPEAADWAHRALQRDPLSSHIHYTLALIHQELGDTERAIAEFKKTIYLDPNFVLAHFELATLYGRLGCPRDAARHRGHAIRLAARLAEDDILPGSDDLTARRLLSTLRRRA